MVVTADHGESLTEHDYLFDHGDHLYDVSLRVPLVARWPGTIPGGTVVDCSTPTTAIYSAVLNLMGIEDNPVGSVFRGEAPCEDAPVLATTVTERFADPPPIAHAYRTSGHKRVQPANGEVVCFDLATDPGENSPQAGCPEPVVEAMAASLKAQVPVRAPQTDAETESALKELGYLD